MGTDWFIKAECPRPSREIISREALAEACSGCPFVIWEMPESVGGFLNSMCGVRVGNIWMAEELADIGEQLTGISCFTIKETGSSEKLAILEKIKDCAKQDGWRFRGFSQEETLGHLDLLIEFCKRVGKEELPIFAWA